MSQSNKTSSSFNPSAPNFRPRSEVLMKTPVEKEVLIENKTEEKIVEVVESSKPLFTMSFEVDAEDAVAFGFRHKKAFGGEGGSVPIRTSGELIQQGTNILYNSFEGMIFGWHSDPPLISPESLIKVVGNVMTIESKSLRSNVGQVLTKHLGKSLVTYLGSRGPMNANRFWLRIGDTTFKGVDDGKDAILVVAFPDLVLDGNHGALMTAFCESIKNYLDAGGESSIVNFMENSGIVPAGKMRGYCFSKAIHTRGFPVDKINDHKEDMDLIFSKMKGAKGKGNLSDLLFLCNDYII